MACPLPHRRYWSSEEESRGLGSDLEEGSLLSESPQEASSSDFDDMVATRRRNYTRSDAVHDGDRQPGDSIPADTARSDAVHDGERQSGDSIPIDTTRSDAVHDDDGEREAARRKTRMEDVESRPADTQYQVLRREWDWEERRLPSRLTRNRFKRAYICLRPSCRDELGTPKSFATLQGLNHHRVTKHAGATVIFTDKGVARARVSNFLNAPVRSTKDKNVYNVYMKQHRLEKSAGIQFQAFFQSTCLQHEEAWAEQKSSFIQNYIEQGMRDYKARKEGKKVRTSHGAIIESKGCIMCLGGPSQCASMEDTKDVDLVGECSQKDYKDSIIDISSSDSEHEELGTMEGLHESEDLVHKMEESSLDGMHAQDVDIASPLVSATMSRVDDVVDKLCESFTQSLPRSNKGATIRLVNYSESSEDEGLQLQGVHGKSDVAMPELVPEPLPTTQDTQAVSFGADLSSTHMHLGKDQRSTRAYNTRFGGVSTISYAEKPKNSKKRGQRSLEILD